VEDPTEVIIRIDDDGVGGGVTDQADGYRFVGVSGASRPLDTESYPNKRSELWFAVAERASEGLVDISRLPQDVQQSLRRQAMSPTWRLDAAGRRVVEPKKRDKEAPRQVAR